MLEDQRIESRSDAVSATPISMEKIQMVLASLNNPSNFNVTSEHLDEILAQRKQVNEFVHEDKKEELAHQRFILRWSLISILVMSVLILWKAPEYFTQVITALIAGLGGFGIGKSQGK